MERECSSTALTYFVASLLFSTTQVLTSVNYFNERYEKNFGSNLLFFHVNHSQCWPLFIQSCDKEPASKLHSGCTHTFLAVCVVAQSACHSKLCLQRPLQNSGHTLCTSCIVYTRNNSDDRQFVISQ